MISDKDVALIVNGILQSKKYKYLYRPTVERIVNDVSSRYPKNEVEKTVRKKLHQQWGAYSVRPNYNKLLEQAKDLRNNGADVKTVVLPLLKLQTSTNERIGILDDVYSKIFACTGDPKVIVEPACGLNALSYFWMGEDVKYIGYDIDEGQIDFINSVFSLLGVEKKAEARLGDILLEGCNERADLTMLFKILPLLEQQQKSSSMEVIRKIPSNNIAVSFPTRSISGKDKGMTDFYTKQFMEMVGHEAWMIEKLIFDTELVFCIKK